MSAVFSKIAQKSPAMSSLLDSLGLIASLDVPVLLQGATGTGKGLLAEQIHTASRRAEQPFIVINCAALCVEDARQQLFGSVDAEGYLQAAENGTLLLDEVQDLPLNVQTALLRFIEQGEVQVLGASRPRRLDVRILAASNADMLEMTRSGSFRSDLYHRLSVVPVILPVLQDRQADLKNLLRDFSAECAAEFDLPMIRFSAAAIAVLQRYSWPGNVRELKNVCSRLTALLPGRIIEPANLPAGIIKESQQEHLGAMDLVGKEVALIKGALQQAKGNKSRAARLLGISRDTLNYRLRKYELI
jgi:DNA-binding NtrC family response regulator